MKTPMHLVRPVEKVAENTILKDSEFETVAKSVRPDAKKRVVLPQYIEGITYHIYRNKLGQLILDPQITIPASEAWFWENPENVAAYKKSFDQAARGELIEVDLKDL